DVGQYGEGFKVAATCLLRDHRVDIVAGSGGEAVRLRIAEHALPGTNLFPVEYDFFEISPAVAGAWVWLDGCRATLIAAVQSGLDQFFHEANPILGPRRWSVHRAFSLYDSVDGRGHVF